MKRIHEAVCSSTASNSNHKPHILLIEDNVLIQTTINVMLKRLDCEVDIANDGKEALALFCNQYDLIFLDIGLPDIDGLAVASLIRLQEKNQQQDPTPIIVTTAYNNEEVTQRSLNVGVNEIHGKLTTLSQIKKILDTWVM